MLGSTSPSCEFRARLLQHKATERLLDRLLDAAREGGLLKGRGRSRTDSTHVLAAVRNLNRLELVGETLRAALNAIAVAAPDWLRAIAPPDWHKRYDRRVEDMHLPEAGSKRDAYAIQVGTDGFVLLDALDGTDAPPDAAALPEVAVLRRVWTRHFERASIGSGDGTTGGEQAAHCVQMRPVQGRGPADRVESPYDTHARFRSKRDTQWTGYMVHLTETCDEGMPRLVVHADTTPANVHEAERTAAIHDALAAKGLAPSEHLVDSAYVSAGHLVAAHTQHGVDLVGPGRPNVSWQSRSGGDAFTLADFTVDWDRTAVRCPEGKESGLWTSNAKHRGQGSIIHVQFRAADCRPCLARALHPVALEVPGPGPGGDAAARTRGACRRQGAREHGGGQAPVCAAQRHRGHAFTGRVRLRPAPGALPRPAQGGPAARGYRRGPQSRPHRRLVRRTPARADPHLTLCRARSLAGDFANRVRPPHQTQHPGLVKRSFPRRTSDKSSEVAAHGRSAGLAPRESAFAQPASVAGVSRHASPPVRRSSACHPARAAAAPAPSAAAPSARCRIPPPW